MPNTNCEGYPDPTAHNALYAIELSEKRTDRYMPLVYIASAYSGDTAQNAQRARHFSRFAISRGYMPLTPHLLYPQFMDDANPKERELGLRFAIILLNKCEELWVFGEVTEGMKREIERAKKRHIPIWFFTDKCKEVVNDAS